MKGFMRPSALRLGLGTVLVGALTAALLAAVAQSGTAGQVTFPGGNGALTFTRSGVLYTVNPDGSGVRPVRIQGARPSEPAWAPDGVRLAFRSDQGIWSAKRDGSAAKQLTKDIYDSNPAWSPDGKRIAFVRSVGSPSRDRLFVMNADGTGARNVSTGLPPNLHVDNPEWSPDGSRLAFDDGVAAIWVVNADGSGARQLPTATSARYPSWSPDGVRIAYAFTTDAVRVINADGTGDASIAGGLFEVYQVAWSPDGKQVAFVRDNRGRLQEELFVMNVDGSNLRPLNVETDTDLDWGRGTCLVPNVKGKPFAAARGAIAKSRCSVGSVKRAFSAKTTRDRVISQKPLAGTHLAEGGKVNLVVSRGKRR